MNGLSILGTGRHLPEKIMTNDDWAKIVDTNDEWIVSRTGIKQRYFCENETNTEMATIAAKTAIENSGIDINDIAICLVATFCPDNATPSIACMLQKELGLPPKTACLDINAACSGFVYGLALVHGYLLNAEKPYALLVGSEILSRTLDYSDRGSCVLFGDASGAVIVSLSDNKFVTSLGAKGGNDALFCPLGGKIQMDGRAVFRFAVETVPACVHDILRKAGEELDNIDYIVCHQANLRIISSVASKLKLPMEKFYINVQRYGNTSAASIILALDEMREQGLLKPGTKIICVGFGGGLTWGGAYLEF